MKKIVLCLISLLVFHCGYSQMRAKADERFELTSILFALAGAPEYCMCPIPSYFQDIVDELAPFDRSAPVEYARELHQIHRIGYDAVATTAAMLEIENGMIRLRPEYDASGIADLDSRWNEELLRKYIRMLNEFYVLSDFHTFYEEHRPLYEAAEKRMDRVLEQIDCGRFESLFGAPLDPEEMVVYVSLTNGPSNYSVPGGVLIGMSVDREGVPDTAPGTDFRRSCHEYFQFGIWENCCSDIASVHYNSFFSSHRLLLGYHFFAYKVECTDRTDLGRHAHRAYLIFHINIVEIGFGASFLVQSERDMNIPDFFFQFLRIDDVAVENTILYAV